MPRALRTDLLLDAFEMTPWRRHEDPEGPGAPQRGDREEPASPPVLPVLHERQESAGGRWLLWLGVITGVGLGIRLGTVLGQPIHLGMNDAFYYHYSANALAEGLGFINPFNYYLSGAHQLVPTAAFPPMFTFVLFPASLIGFKSFFAHRVWCCLIGAAGIVLCGYAGKEIAGRRVGLLAAALAAVYPNIWMSDGLVRSEALSPVVVALVLLAGYRFWSHPRLSSALVFGASIGVAALTRDELTLLMVLMLLPLALLAKLSWRQRLSFLAAGGVAAALVVAPWIGYNLSRFKDPTFISTGLGVTLVSANCASTWYGPYEGYWSFPCALAAPLKPKSAQVDESVQDVQGRQIALRFIRAHEGRIPRVVLARIGRAFGLFHPLQQIRLDVADDGRPYRWALVGLGTYYVLCLLAIGGVVSLRRRRVPVFPLLAGGLVVLISVVVTFGQTRYRSTFEVSLVILAAIAIDRLWERFRAMPAGVHVTTDRDGTPGNGGHPLPLPGPAGPNDLTERGEPHTGVLAPPNGVPLLITRPGQPSRFGSSARRALGQGDLRRVRIRGGTG